MGCLDLSTVIYLIRVFLWSRIGASRGPNIFFRSYSTRGAVASWLVRSTPDRVVRVRGHCVVWLPCCVLGRTLYSHGASLHPDV